MVGPVGSTPPVITSFDSLKKENETLKTDNERLRMENKEIRDLFDAQNLKIPQQSPSTGAISKPSTFTFHGRVGGPFSIEGVGFGTIPGLVILGNRPVLTTRWIDTSIKGMVPHDYKPGQIDVVVNGTKVTAILK